MTKAGFYVALAALGWMSLSPPARGSEPDASPLFAIYQDICVASKGAEMPAVSAADHLGWMPVPEGLMTVPATDMFTLQSKSARLHTDKEALQVMMAGSGIFDPEGLNLPVNICVVGIKPGDPAAGKVLQAYGGVEARVINDIEFYPFIDAPSGHLPVKDGDVGLREAAAGGNLRIVGVRTGSRSDIVMMIYIAAKRGSH